MQVYESIASASLGGPTFLTIGNFDGVHRGHRALIAAMCQAAKREGAACGLLTFHPHPRSVLRPDQAVPTLTSLHERLALFEQTELDFVILHPFTPATAETEAEDFLHLLHRHLSLSRLWLGADFALGRGRKGTVEFLRRHGQELGVGVDVFPDFTWEGQSVRSSRARRLLELGNVEAVAVQLGRHYTLPGIVVHGAHRGRSIGFPTANLSVAQGRVIPANGVYATWAWLNGQRLPSVTNIGVRPTVGGFDRTIEAHLIDFEGELYGRCLRLDFVDRLRDEIRFPSLDALIAQIARDRDLAAALLARDPQPPAAPRFEELPHTADWAVRVFGATRAELFANAGVAMFTLQGAAESSGPTSQHRIEVEAADEEALLVAWLSRLLWLSETENIAFQRFWIDQIAVDESGSLHLQALACGRQGRGELAHIKAVTYHDLVMIPPPSGSAEPWQARVLFDT